MDHLMKLVTTALEWSYVEAEIDVRSKHLETAAEQLTIDNICSTLKISRFTLYRYARAVPPPLLDS